MIHRGKFLIVAIFLVAVVAASFAWWHQYQKGRHALSLWGAGPAVLIRHAPRVELLRLKAPAEIAVILGHKDISRARGIVHARQALVEDASFDFQAARGDCEPHWQYALRFSDAGQRATVQFDFDCGRARLEESGQEVAMTPKLAAGMKKFIQEQLRPPEVP